MANPNFSIIVPTLNEEKYITNLLLSLEAQTYKNFEVIIVDNGSTDNTVNIIKHLQKKLSFPLKIVFCKKKGISYVRNYGVKFAKGKYLVFFDADGYVHKQWFKNAKFFLEENTYIKALSGIYFHYPVKNILKLLYYNSYLILYNLFVLIYKITSGKYFLYGNNMVIDKKAFIQAGMFPHVVHEDIVFSRKFCNKFNCRKSVKLCTKMLVYYSPRRFEQKGYLKTLIGWIKDLKTKKGSKYYDTYR